MKIRTTYHPDAPNALAFSAIDDDTYDGAEDSPNRYTIGYGPTRDAAIIELLNLLNGDEYV